jgi:hypothetical protein
MAGYYQTKTMLRAEFDEANKGTEAPLRVTYEQYLKNIGLNSEAEAIAKRAKEDAEGKVFGTQQAAIDSGVFGYTTRADRKISDEYEAQLKAAQAENDAFAAKQIIALSGGRITGQEPVYVLGTPEHEAYMQEQFAQQRATGKPAQAPNAYLDAQAFAERYMAYDRLGSNEPTNLLWDDVKKAFYRAPSPFFDPKIAIPTVGMGNDWAALKSKFWATVEPGVGRTAATDAVQTEIDVFFGRQIGYAPGATIRDFPNGVKGLGFPGGFDGEAAAKAAGISGKTVVSTTKDANGNTITQYSDGTSTTISKTGVVTKSGIVDEATKALQKQIDDLKSQAAASKLAYDTAAQDKADAIKAERVSAYTTLKTEFDKYGLGSLVDDVKNLILNGTPKSEATLKLRATDAYQLRFAGNKARLAAGKNLYDESTYLGLENDFQASFEVYGQKALLGNTRESAQTVFADFIATDKSPDEIKSRIRLAVEEVRDRKDIRTEFQKYFPEISDSDLVSYFLKPKETLSALTTKVRVAQIGSAASRQDLTASLATATDLEQLGITEQQAKEGYKKVATDLPAIEKLGAIDNVNINQTTAENAYLKGLASEQRKIDQAAERERNRFAQSSGINKVSLTSPNAKSII